MEKKSGISDNTLYCDNCLYYVVGNKCDLEIGDVDNIRYAVPYSDGEDFVHNYFTEM